MLTKDLCLVLNFRDAKTFSRNPFKDTHRMVEASGWNKRSDRPGTWVEVPPDTLSVLHVSNVLHVLAGERPVPSVRQTAIPGSPTVNTYLMGLAEEALVRVTEGVYSDSEGARKTYKDESLMTRKCSTASVMPVGLDKFALDNSSWDTRSRLIVWDRAKYSMGLTVYKKFVGMAEAVLGLSEIASKQSLLYTLKALRASGSPDVKVFLGENKVKQPWGSLLTDGAADLSGLKSGYTDANYMMAYTVARGREFISVRSGVIYVPISEEDKALFQKGPGWATLLEGGVVSIQDVTDMSTKLTQGTTPVQLLAAKEKT